MKYISDKNFFEFHFFRLSSIVRVSILYCIQFVQRKAKFSIVVNALGEILYRVHEHISGRCCFVSGLVRHDLNKVERFFNESMEFRDNHWPTCHFSFNFVWGFSDIAFNYLPSESRTSLWFVIDLIEISKCATRKQDVFRAVFVDKLAWEQIFPYDILSAANRRAWETCNISFNSQRHAILETLSESESGNDCVALNGTNNSTFISWNTLMHLLWFFSVVYEKAKWECGWCGKKNKIKKEHFIYFLPSTHRIVSVFNTTSYNNNVIVG